MNDSDEERSRADVEVLGPETQSSSGATDESILIALIKNYTDRPDLLLKIMEESDPGFIKSMNEDLREQANRSSEGRFLFGRRQAYTSLCMAVAAGLATVVGLLVLVFTGEANFWNIAALGIFYAITQGGRSGFVALIKGAADAIRSYGSKE